MAPVSKMRCWRATVAMSIAKGTPTGRFPRGGFSIRRMRPTAPAQELAFARQHFFRPHRARDPFGNTAFTAFYDLYDLAPAQTTDPLGNRTSAEYDLPPLQPFRMTDPTGNRTEVAFRYAGAGGRNRR